jgi:hypothetical protein
MHARRAARLAGSPRNKRGMMNGHSTAGMRASSDIWGDLSADVHNTSRCTCATHVSRYGGAVYGRNCARATRRLQQSSSLRSTMPLNRITGNASLGGRLACACGHHGPAGLATFGKSRAVGSTARYDAAKRCFREGASSRVRVIPPRRPDCRQRALGTVFSCAAVLQASARAPARVQLAAVRHMPPRTHAELQRSYRAAAAVACRVSRPVKSPQTPAGALRRRKKGRGSPASVAARGACCAGALVFSASASAGGSR